MTVYCVIHDTLEAAPKGSFQCFECKHVYTSHAALIMAWNSLQQRMAEESLKPHPFDEILPVTRTVYVADVRTLGDDIPFCPYCMHDF